MKQYAIHAIWQQLQTQAQTLRQQHLTTLFAADDTRVQQLSTTAAGLYLDCSKQRLTPPVLALLQQLAQASGLAEHRHALFTGDVVNATEQRAAWHVALRAPRASAFASVDALAVRDAMGEFVDAVRSGAWRGCDGRAITDIVNIGIGGSDLGPRLVYRALAAANNQPRAHFVANVDPADLRDTLAGLEPATTLFVIASKTFTTAETMANARAARQWLQAVGVASAELKQHMVAVSTNRAAVTAFGIEHMFGFWDWVGGRYSLWSAVGLSVALALGMAEFERLLAGAHAMDQHFLDAPLAQNLPVQLALVGIWNRNFLGLPGHVVVPYAQRLAHFAEWLQQLAMESNGKSVTRTGQAVRVATVPMVWGTVGTNAQHAYFQMLHQAPLAADVDFILPLTTAADDDGDDSDNRDRQRIANCLAQAEALMHGQAPQADQGGHGDNASDNTQQTLVAAARHCDGNRPSNMLLMQRLDAYHLGALLAAYEHKTFVQGVIWDINSFDQWGVELGKSLAGQLLQELENPAAATAHDASTASLLARVRAGTGS